MKSYTEKKREAEKSKEVLEKAKLINRKVVRLAPGESRDFNRMKALITAKKNKEND